MKCALELIAIRDLAIETEEKRLDEEAREKWEINKEHSIYLCENKINDDLTEKAEKGKTLSITYEIYLTLDRLGNQRFDIVEDAGYSNAGGRVYKRSNWYYDTQTVIDYLKAHCLEAKISENYTIRNSYHYAKLKCYDLKITANPLC